MKSTMGKNIKVTIWGGSHEPNIGVDIEGFPLGAEIDMKELTAFLKRRAPGNSFLTTKRREQDIALPTAGVSPTSNVGQSRGDIPEPLTTESKSGYTSDPADCTPAFLSASACTLSGAVADTALPTSKLTVTGHKVSFEIKNTDTRSSDYGKLRSVPRPGHADFTARIRYGDKINMAGGGPFSARMTAPLCIAGGIALQLLKNQDIEIGAHIFSVADAEDKPFDPVNLSPVLLEDLKSRDLAIISEDIRPEMIKRIVMAKECGDSVGGVIEVCALGLPAGIGGAMYEGLESVLAPIFFGIPAVKGVEFGAGFGASKLYGSVNNDSFYFDGGKVKTRTNNHGGILGGITTGMPLIARLAFKPTPSINKEQASVDLDKTENTKLTVRGRHDPCVAVRAVPIVEAALALGILDCMMEERK